MRLKSTFMGTVEIVGDVTNLQVKDDWLIMDLRTTTPTGWSLRAALTHADIMNLLKLLFKPRNLLYIVFGFRKPRDKNRVPEY